MKIKWKISNLESQVSKFMKKIIDGKIDRMMIDPTEDRGRNKSTF